MADIARQTLASAYVGACRAEIEALKPGNVHIYSSGHGMVVEQFLLSAEVSAAPLTEPTWPLGLRALEAVKATRAAVGLNTNLGIVLLCAPILMGAQATVTGKSLPDALSAVLLSLDKTDARDVFAAIAHASPGGLGDADDDVRAPPRIGVLEAMHQASDRDRIAWQYSHGFGDIFERGLPALDDAARLGQEGMWPCISAYLTFLSAFPDSHIARKFGDDTARHVQMRAHSVRKSLKEKTPDAAMALLHEFDSELKAANLNPGTSADLTVASLLVRDLRDNLHIAIDDA